MRVVYLGTPTFAVLPLEKIIQAGYDVVAVISQPDRPIGRKMILTPTPVKECAIKHNIPVLQFEKINEHATELSELKADVMVTCAYGQIISQQILDIPPKGIFNIHASLLPKYRGASPIQSVILNGEQETGVTIMKTAIGMDSGDIVDVVKTQILPNETSGELFERLSPMGADLIVKVLKDIENNTITLTPQNENDATFCKMIKKEDAKIDWYKDAQYVLNKIRGYNPAPVAFTSLLGKQFKIFTAQIVDFSGRAGEVLYCDKQNGLVVACQDKSLKLLSVQLEGSKRMDAKDFILGNRLKVGDKLGL